MFYINMLYFFSYLFYLIIYPFYKTYQLIKKTIIKKSLVINIDILHQFENGTKIKEWIIKINYTGQIYIVYTI